MAIQQDLIKDLITTTQRELGELKFTELASDLTEHVAMSELLRKSRITFDSGVAIQWNLMIGHSNAAKEVGLFEVDSLDIQDVMITANAPWRHLTVNYAIERRELAMNREPRRLVELVKIRRSDAMASLAELMEARFWSAPPASDTKRVWGVNYWIVHNGTGADGFLGQTPSGYTEVAGVNPANFPRWRNWSGTPTALASDNNLNSYVEKWREAAVKTNFRPIPNVTNTPYGTGNSYGYYTNYGVLQKLENRLTQQNDNLGNDLAPKDGKVIFRGVPVTYVPYLDKASVSNPVYGINWGKFKPVFLSGEFMREMGPETAPNQHTTYVTHVDTTMNFICYDRRRQFILSSNTDQGGNLGLD
jgi:hypothetical protein